MQPKSKTPARKAAQALLQALEQLRLADDKAHWSTSEVLKASGLSMSARGQNLKVLMTLHSMELVSRTGKGSFSWRLDKPYDNADLAKFKVDDSGDEEKPAPAPKPAEKTPCRKCNGSGKWVNPRNTEDKRDCFACNGSGLSSHSGSGNDFDKNHPIIRALSDDISGLYSTIAELEQKLANVKRGNQVIEIKKYDGSSKKIKKTLPAVFEVVLKLAECRRNILLVGPPGCGKTYIGECIADALDLPFGAISCTSGMSEVHLLGRSVPDLASGMSHFQGTKFLDCYENGGVFLFDELDAADSNLMLAINSAIANGYANVPNRESNPTAKMHEDFVCIAAANTYGQGADRQFVGRNQMDAATLDRFAIGTVNCDYDGDVESMLCPFPELLKRCHAIRAAIKANGLRRFMSTRFIRDAAVMHENGWSAELIEDRYFSGWSADEKARVINACKYV